jgi:hypothetical protein
LGVLVGDAGEGLLGVECVVKEGRARRTVGR